MAEWVMVVMGATLDRACADVFSETARSRLLAREAARHRLDRRVAAVLRRGAPDDLAERPAERAEAREAHVEADLGDAAVGLAQEEHRALDAPALEVAVRRLPE